MGDIDLELTIDEGKTVFQALTELPFRQVFELIGKINEQSNKQIILQEASEGEIELKLSKSEMIIVHEALSKQPYDQVYKIMEKIFSKQTV